MPVRGGFKAVLATAALLAASPARALDPSLAIGQYRHQSWSTREGLPQSSVEALLQTRDGYLWVGTQEGLARFDGVRFVVFDKSNTKAMKANRVVALCESREGDLWIGTEGGGIMRMRQGAFTTWRETDGLPNDRVRAIVEDAAGISGSRPIAGSAAGRAARSPLPGWEESSSNPCWPPATARYGWGRARAACDPSGRGTSAIRCRCRAADRWTRSGRTTTARCGWDERTCSRA